MRESGTMPHPRTPFLQLSPAALCVACVVGILSGGCGSKESDMSHRTIHPVETVPVAPPSLIPRPASLIPGEGAFTIDKHTALYFDPSSRGARDAARFLADVIEKGTRLQLAVKPATMSEAPSGGILLTAADADPALGNEGYSLTSTRLSVTIRAPGDAGLFYGAQTLRQLLPPEIESRPPGNPAPGWAIPCLRVDDQPRFAWRGLMLDSSRHFQDKDFILHVLDVMAGLKLNRFHWHLVDANGWRLQIDRYPRLTDIAAWRGEGDRRHGGFYTKDDVREILAHAKDLHIDVIPEIEMPAHEAAALFAYPELTCSGKVFPVGDGGLDHYSAHVGNIPFCAGRDETFVFLENVLTEVCDLFDSPIIHVGGDERPKGLWEKCPLCQERIRAEGLKDEHDLQNWFMRRIVKFLASKNRRAISWAVTRSDPYNPTDMDDLGHGALIQNWHEGTRFAARQGWDIVNSANGFVYLDYPEFPGMGKPKWMPLLDLEKVYSFEPVPADLEPEFRKHILGGEACLWTELLPREKVYGALFPRMLALAEVVWSPADGKDFADFRGRVERMEGRLGRMGVEYGKPPEADGAPGEPR